MATFDTGILSEPVEVLGRPIIRLRVAIDKPLGNLAVRLVDDARHYHIKARVSAFENDKLVNERRWEKSIPRDFM